MASNPYSDFPCHKTADLYESDDGENDGYVHGENSFTCHGFKTLQMAENATKARYEREGFKPDGKGFECPHQMIEAHTEAWDD